MGAAEDLVALAEGRELEEALAGAADEGAALVGQVDELVEAEAVDHVVGQDGAVGALGLADQGPRPRLVQEHVVHQARPPGRHPVRAPEPHVAHQRVPPAVEVARAVVRAQAVLLLVFRGVLATCSGVGCSSSSFVL